MLKTILLIDGENFKGKVKDVFKDAGRIDTPIWHEFDYKGLFDKVLNGTEIDHTIFYFARIKEHPTTLAKSRALIEEQRLLKTHLEKQGFEVVLSGRVRGHDETIKGSTILVFKEKGVDVKIAVDMVSMACDKSYERIIIGSSDSDLQPAIAEVKKRSIKCTYLGFEINPNKGLSYTTGRSILIRNSEVFEFEKNK